MDDLAHIRELMDERDRRYSERFDAQEQAIAAALAAQEKAVTKAEVAAEKRFDAVNEFRQQLSDQAAQFMPRLEAEQRIGQISENVNSLEDRHGKALTRVNSRLDVDTGSKQGAVDYSQSMNRLILVVLAAITVAVGVVSLVVTTH